MVMAGRSTCLIVPSYEAPSGGGFPDYKTLVGGDGEAQSPRLGKTGCTKPDFPYCALQVNVQQVYPPTDTGLGSSRTKRVTHRRVSFWLTSKLYLLTPTGANSVTT